MDQATAERVYSNGVGWIEVVRHNAQHAVKCSLRREAWANLVINRARGQTLNDGLWMKAYGRVTTPRKKILIARGAALATKMYAMPCVELARMPLLIGYDAALQGGDIPMPDFAR